MMRRPLVSLAWSLAATVKRQREVIARQAALLDQTQHELAVQRTRVKRWRRTALEMAQHLPERARTAVSFQCDSDDLADLPEIEDR